MLRERQRRDTLGVRGRTAPQTEQHRAGTQRHRSIRGAAQDRNEERELGERADTKHAAACLQHSVTREANANLAVRLDCWKLYILLPAPSGTPTPDCICICGICCICICCMPPITGPPSLLLPPPVVGMLSNMFPP